METKKVIQQFVESVINSNEALIAGNKKLASKYGKISFKCLKSITDMGNKGKMELSALFQHDNQGVRAATATFLLDFRPEEALAILKEIAKGDGLVPFSAGEAIKRWEEKQLVSQFTKAVVKRNEALIIGDDLTALNNYKNIIQCLRKLHDDEGMGKSALHSLLKHENLGVRAAAAASLLDYDTEEALSILEEAVKGDGPISFEAREAIKRWKEGGCT